MDFDDKNSKRLTITAAEIINLPKKKKESSNSSTKTQIKQSKRHRGNPIGSIGGSHSEFHIRRCIKNKIHQNPKSDSEHSQQKQQDQKIKENLWRGSTRVGGLPTTLDPPEPSVMDDQLGVAVSEVGLQRSDRSERFLGGRERESESLRISGKEGDEGRG